MGIVAGDNDRAGCLWYWKFLVGKESEQWMYEPTGRSRRRDCGNALHAAPDR